MMQPLPILPPGVGEAIRSYTHLTPGVPWTKQLMQELVESQGRRQMQEWLKLDQASHDSLAQKNNRASTSPTREYLQRKFNSSKRKKEVNFFKQAHKMQI